MNLEGRLPCRFITCGLTLLLLSTPVGAQDQRPVRIAFFGHEGFNVTAIRDALPLHDGDLVPLDPGADGRAGHWRQSIRDAVMRVVGREPTDVKRVCCDEHGRVLLYIGLPGTSVRAVRYKQTPDGASSLPESLVRLHARIDDLQFKAIAEGRAAEDYSEGYSLAKDDAPLRSAQLAWRDEVRRHEARVFDVLGSSADAEQRRTAATAAGYARASDRQIDALVEASFDADEGVRNNAVRALGVLLMTQPERGRRIPSPRFVDLLSSPLWSDRNKGLIVLQGLTAASRDNALLRDLRQRAWPSLIEMAQWPRIHALPARLILARVIGLDEQQLADLLNEEPPHKLLQAVQGHR
jgi:hypothetical protein